MSFISQLEPAIVFSVLVYIVYTYLRHLRSLNLFYVEFDQSIISPQFL